MAWGQSTPVSFQIFIHDNFHLIETYFFCSLYGIKEDVLEKSFYMFSSCYNFDKLKQIAHKQMYPHATFLHTCTLMLLANLAEPHWIYHSCFISTLRDVVCQQNEDESKTDTSQQTLPMRCPLHYLAQEHTCYTFKWLTKNFTKNLLTEHNCSNSKLLILSDMQTFQPFFNAIATKFPTILSPHHSNSIQIFTYDNHFNTFNFVNRYVDQDHAEGFYVCQTDRQKIVINTNIFSCSASSHTSYLFVCDGSVDCPNDNSDESNCSAHDSLLTPGNHTRKECPFHYFMDYHGNCAKYYLKQEHKKMNLSQMYLKKDSHNCRKDFVEINDTSIQKTLDICKRTDVVISCVFRNDLFADCGEDAEDEETLLNLFSMGEEVPCENPSQIACRQGHSACFQTSDICIFILNKYNHLAPCRNGGHLEDCRYFEYNMLFKCLQSYCIPWSYICDDKWDCPSGDDELSITVCGNVSVCEQLYRCKNTDHMCIHLGNICDNVLDCPLGDDEFLCELNFLTCPTECQCLLLAITCKGWANPLSGTTYPHIFVALSNTESENVQSMLEKFGDTLFLCLSEHDIKTVCQVMFPEKLLTLNLQNNMVETLDSDCFPGLKTLKCMDLGNNKMNYLPSKTFHSLTMLKFLNLSNNPLGNLPVCFAPLTSNHLIVSLFNLSAPSIHVKAFDGTSVIVVDTNDYHICCITPDGSNCNAPTPWYASCHDLLQSAQLIWFIVGSISIFILNTVSVLVQISTKHLGKVFAVLVITLNLSDMLIVLYLCLIWASHLKLKGIFGVNEEFWRSSVPCFVAFGSVLWFSILTQILLIFVSLSRLMVVVHPINTEFKSTKFVIRSETCFVLLLMHVKRNTHLCHNFCPWQFTIISLSTIHKSHSLYPPC